LFVTILVDGQVFANHVLQLPGYFLEFGGQEEGSCAHHLGWISLEWFPHIEPMEIGGCGGSWRVIDILTIQSTA
jgi:hypothetical protein